MKDYLKSYKGKTALITGGAGCIGSNLTAALAKAGAKKIIVLDDLSSSEEWNVPKLPGVEFIKGDVTDNAVLDKVFSAKPQYVLHLAALFANQNSVDHPERDLMVNGMGILKVLECSRSNKVEKFVFASSGCSVYGSQAPLPLKEDYVSINLDTPYQITKLLGELYCNFFYNFYSLPVVRLRFFNVYGPGEIPGKYRNVIPNFIYKALHKQALPIMGTGKETRDFTFVEDIVDGVLRGGAIKEAVGEAINLASETETKVIYLADKINKALKNDKGVEFIERRNWDKITKRRASISKAKKVLGYNPKTNIEKGLTETITWVQNNLEKIEGSMKR